MNRYRAGFVDVRNPFNPKLVSRIHFENVDAILFCTKNPLPILDHLQEIKQPILFHVTLTPYKNDIEVGVPSKKELVEAIKKLSSIIGSEHLFIRYDPIFLSEKYNIAYHVKAFDRMCTLLEGYVQHIIVSFIDDYKNVRKNQKILKKRPFTEEDYREIGIHFSKSAKKHGMSVQTCLEERNLKEYGFKVDACLSHAYAYQLTGKTYKNWTARKCSCVNMVDIGAYNSCKHYCKYCYANYDEDQIEMNCAHHDDASSLLIGTIEKDDQIKERIQ